jgi:hypothetical protein
MSPPPCSDEIRRFQYVPPLPFSLSWMPWLVEGVSTQPWTKSVMLNVPVVPSTRAAVTAPVVVMDGWVFQVTLDAVQLEVTRSTQVVVAVGEL